MIEVHLGAVDRSSRVRCWLFRRPKEQQLSLLYSYRCWNNGKRTPAHVCLEVSTDQKELSVDHRIRAVNSMC